jgi:uncharacterized protein
MQIPVSHGRLEANLRQAEGPLRGAAVICHPHPLHGGTMHTKAVFRTAQALSEAGFHVVRFNFRGVGASTGSYDDGIGEQDDVRATLDWLEERYPDLPLLVGGFSFGSFVGLRVGVEDDRVKGLLGLGLPAEMWDFGFLEGATKPLLVIQGEEDQFGSGEEVAGYLDGLAAPATLVRIPGSDHFFNDRFDELQEAVGEWFAEGEGGEVFPVREDE